MIWILIATYALAGFTIGRMAWEFDAYADMPQDKALCWATAFLWPLVPAWGVWIWVAKSRR